MYTNEPSAGDGNGHGTHMAGLACGTQFGVAKASNIISVRVMNDAGNGSVTDIISGLNWVLSQHRSSRRPSVVAFPISGSAHTGLDNAISSLTNNGIHVVVAAGNGNVDIRNISPARVPSVISVGASNIEDARASTSNYGANITLFAPGQNSISASNANNTATSVLSGTSIGAAHVAGLVAYFIGLVGNMSPTAMIAKVKEDSLIGQLSNIPLLPTERPADAEVDLPPPPYQRNGHGSSTSLVNQSPVALVSATLSSTSNSLESSSDARAASKENSWRRWLTRRSRLSTALVLFITAGLVACVVCLPVYFKVLKRRQQEDASIGVVTATSGGVYNSSDPFNNAAQPNSWTPPLNASWDFTTQGIHGVNLGGLFILERMTSPAIFERYPDTVDEWDLSIAMASDLSNGGLGQIEEHYRTFITEKDIADIAGTGLTWVRLPIGFWAIETWPREPFLERTSWKYIVRVLQWCRKYGLRVNLVLYSVPGSANGGTTGGKWGQLHFLSGVMGIANAQRTLYYIRVLAEFISRPEWTNVVPMLTIVHSPVYRAMGIDQMRNFYNEAYRTVREAAGYGAGNGPYLVMFDGTDSSSGIFEDGFMSGADRVILERIPSFIQLNETEGPIEEHMASSPYNICRWGPRLNQSRALHGITIGSEITADFWNCGLMNRAAVDATYGGGCNSWIFTPIEDWSLGIKSTLLQYVSAQMDTLRDYFFFTWKVRPYLAFAPRRSDF
ncbi:hypothetical protein MD484_g6462, partial [Candolleomyces efflorescens]